MASDRKAAKGSITESSSADPELESAISSGHELQLKIAQEGNRHAEAMHRADIGFLGRAFGGEKSAPTYIAFIVTVAGMAGAVFCWFQCMGTIENPVKPEAAEFWSKQAERALAFSGAALAFIFGRGAK